MKAERSAATSRRWGAYLMSAVICGVAAALAALLPDALDLANIVMVFLLGVLAVAVRYGRGPAIFAAFLSVATFDFLYVPPRYSFSVADVQVLPTFVVMLVVALVIGQLTAALRSELRIASAREARMRALYAMSRDLSGAILPEQVARMAAHFLDAEFEARAALMVADDEGRLQRPLPVPTPASDVDIGIAQRVFDHAEPAGIGADAFPEAPLLYLPLKAAMRTRGVLAVEPRHPARLGSIEQRRPIEACASLLAISLERIHYVDVARRTTVQMESDRLRHSLLSAISHDLRTPLAALVAMADTLDTESGGVRGADTARRIREGALRMTSQVNNLLDMARLQSGPVHLRRQWLPLEEAVGSAVRALEGTLDAARVRVQLQPDLPLLSVDPSLFERVLCNLLENAAKFAPPATAIDIDASVVEDRIRITVDDTGPGLPPGREQAIFQLFERGRRESATPGVGLGLAICRAIVEAHGGTIAGMTRPAGGARFTIDLPRLEAPPLRGTNADDRVREPVA